MATKLYLSQIRDLKKERGKKLSPKETQAKNKEIFDKSYFGQILKEQRKHIGGV